MDLPSYNGDLGRYLGRELTSGDQNDFNRNFGYDNARANYEFQSGGNVYRLQNNNNGTRSISQIDSVANRMAKKQKEEADALLRENERKQAETLARQKAERDARFTENRGLLSGLTDEFKTAVPQIFDTAYQNFNIPGLLDTTNALKGRVDDLRENFSGHGAGGYASASQVDKAINTNYLPRYLQSNEQLQRGVGLAQQEVATKIKPYETQIEVMDKQIAREITSYDMGQQRELDSLLAQLNAGVQLSGQKMSLLATLATNEMNYAQTLAKIQADKQIADQNASIEREKISKAGDAGRYMEIGAGQYVYDTQTGKIVLQTPEKAKAAGSGGTWS